MEEGISLGAEEVVIADLPAPERLCDRINQAEGQLRLALMESIIDSGGPLDEGGLNALPQLMHFDLARDYPALIEKQLLVTAQGQIRFVYPVSALPTQHRVRLSDGRRFHAMCAIDAMGSAFVFRQDVEVSSRCSFCDVPMELAIRDGEIAGLAPPQAHVLHVDLAKFSDWSGNC